MPIPFPELLRSLMSDGYSCFPVFCFKEGKGREKKPLAPWKHLQTAPTSEEEATRWNADALIASHAGVGIAIPEGVCILDIDHPRYDPVGLLRTLPGLDSVEPVVVRTPGGGCHAYFRVPPGHGLSGWTAVPAFSNGEAVLDIRISGNYIVAPGSPLWPQRPSSGDTPPCGEYTGSLVPVDELPMLPPDTLSAVLSAYGRTERKNGGTGKAYEQALYGHVSEGSRHEAAISLSVKVLEGVTTDKEIPESKDVFDKILLERFDNDPSFNPQSREVRSIWESAVKKIRAEWTANAANMHLPGTPVTQSDAPTPAQSVWPFAWEGDGSVYGDLVTARILFAGADAAQVIHINARAFIAQPSFREEFLKSVGVILPQIPGRAFQSIVSRLRISKVESRINLLAERLRTNMGEMVMSERAITETDDFAEMKRVMSSSDFVKTTDPETGQASILFIVDSIRRMAGFANEQPWTIDAALISIGAVRRPVAEFGLDAYSYSVSDL